MCLISKCTFLAVEDFDEQAEAREEERDNYSEDPTTIGEGSSASAHNSEGSSTCSSTPSSRVPSNSNSSMSSDRDSGSSAPTTGRRRGVKRKPPRDTGFSSEVMALLSKLDEQAEAREEERERKRMLLEADLEEK